MAEDAEGRVIIVAVEDSADSTQAFDFAVQNMYRAGDQLHLVHVIPRLHFAAAYGVPPVDFVPSADSNT